MTIGHVTLILVIGDNFFLTDVQGKITGVISDDFLSNNQCWFTFGGITSEMVTASP
jgi:hypothetical protein